MTNFAAENNPHLDPDEFALALDTAMFALLPGKRFLARPIYGCEQGRIANERVRDEHGLAAKPTHMIVDLPKGTGRYLRYAIYIAPSETLPIGDEDCIAHLRRIGAAL